ncbi:unnamed protein product [Diamesa tonsa]
MSKAKSRGTDVCGDCGLQDPTFCSLNRGILLCSDCCSVHRSLGRHISIIKSLRQGSWSPSVLNFINQLNAHGANSVWEHLIHDPNSKQKIRSKPSPKDSIQQKTEFIRAKHVNLAYVLKPNLQANEDATSLEVELSKQLHASVRTSNLETSLRLLVQGADPNFCHEEKGRTTPIHVASKFGQAAQVELLIVYGADLNVPDGNGNSAIDLAKQNQYLQIAERLTESLYEVTDRIIYFLCGRKPDHSSGQHLIIPEQSKIEISEHLKIARGKLQLIPNRMFEELVMDLYEEVDRRETEAIWATCSSNPEIGGVPFLPTNPHLSATRNQGRQKLARFSQTEFCGLLTDVLIDARRRQNIANLRPLDSLPPSHLQPNFAHYRQRESNLSDDEPLYDAVADDDYGQVLTPVAQQKTVEIKSMPTIPTTNGTNVVEVETLKRQLKNSEMTIAELKTMVERLATENSMLKTRVDSKSISPDVQLRINDPPEDADNEVEPVLDIKPNGSLTNASYSFKRPVSMYEARQQPRDDNRPPITQSLYSMGSSSGSSSNSNQALPLVEEVTKRTELVTRRIQELWVAMQDLSKKDSFVPCSERIRVGIAELIAIFPQQNLTDEVLKNALKQLNINTSLIQTECTSLQRALSSDNSTNVELYLQQVRNCAYNLAKATKTLVTQFQQ